MHASHVQEVNDGISDLEAERGEHEAKKKALQEQIRSLQDESSELMQVGAYPAATLPYTRGS